MPLVHNFLQRIGYQAVNKQLPAIDMELLARIEEIAEEEQRPLPTIIEELLWYALQARQSNYEVLELWQRLTPREQQAAALACLGYTNREIAQVMVISKNTVRTHMRQILRKFGLNGKPELRELLATWDFSQWLKNQDL